MGADPLFFGEEGQYLRAARLVWRRRRLVLACVLSLMSLASYVAFDVMTRYSAKALLVVGDVQTADERFPDDDKAIDTQIAMLTSPAQLQAVLDSLWQEPRFRDIIPRYIDLERHLKVEQELKSRLISITFTAKSPTVAAEVANRAATLYVEGLAGRLQFFDNATTQSADKIAELQAALQRAEAALSNAQEQRKPETTIKTIKTQIAALTSKIEAAKVNQRLAERRNEDRRQLQIVSPPIRLFALATPPETPSSLPPIIVIAPMFFVSLIFGAGLALLLGRLDQRCYDVFDLADSFDVSCLGAVPDAKRRHAAKLVHPSGRRSHVFETIVTCLLHIAVERPKIIFVTSCREEKGKTSFASNFAAVASRLQRRVLLIDIDTSRASPESYLAGAPGLFDVLTGACEETEAIRTAPNLPLDIMPIGRMGSDPLADLSNDRLAVLLCQLKTRYDCLVINGPPVLDWVEARLISAKADQMILVVRSRVSALSDVSEALRRLHSSANGMAMRPGRIVTVLATRPARRQDEITKLKRPTSKTVKRAPTQAKPAKATTSAPPLADTAHKTSPAKFVEAEPSTISGLEIRQLVRSAEDKQIPAHIAEAPQTPADSAGHQADSQPPLMPVVSAAKKHLSGYRPRKMQPPGRLPTRRKPSATKREVKMVARHRRPQRAQKALPASPRKYALMSSRLARLHARAPKGKKLRPGILQRKKAPRR